MLYSNSVVFMPTPTMETWAMEGKLVPFYHYIPIKSDFSNVPEMLAWARQNDDVARVIARQATEYMEQLYQSRAAGRANFVIQKKMMERYHNLYGDTLSTCGTTTTTTNRTGTDETKSIN